MGAPKDGGYMQKDTLSPQQMTLLNQIISQSGSYADQAAKGYQQFLPGGGGGQAITDQANRNFEQQTIPQILNSFGTGSRGSSALNQALASGASNLNGDLAAMLSKLQLDASNGLGTLANGQSQLGLNTPAFAYAPKQKPFWQEATLGGINAIGKIAAAKFGAGG